MNSVSYTDMKFKMVLHYDASVYAVFMCMFCIYVYILHSCIYSLLTTKQQQNSKNILFLLNKNSKIMSDDYKSDVFIVLSLCLMTTKVTCLLC